jgi:hypothetical protein
VVLCCEVVIYFKTFSSQNRYFLSICLLIISNSLSFITFFNRIDSPLATVNYPPNGQLHGPQRNHTQRPPHGRLLLVAHAVWLDLSQSHDGVDDHGHVFMCELTVVVFGHFLCFVCVVR